MLKAPEVEYPHSDLTKKVIGAAMEVHTTLRSGLNEKIYENALCVELGLNNIEYSQQSQFPVHYKKKYVGKLIPDLIVEEKVIVDAKSTEGITGEHIAQMLSYLSITELEIGLIINFRNQSLKFKKSQNSKITTSHNKIAFTISQ